MAITAKDVMSLRDQTGAGMMDCKKALSETNGDIEAAIDHLRKQGLKSADKKASRTTGEGRVYAKVAEDGRAGALIAIECETDFVARTPDFDALLEDLASHVHEHKPASAEEMLEQSWSKSDGTVSEAIRLMVGKLGENLRLVGAAYVSCPSGVVGSYIHHNQKVGVLAAVETKKSAAEAAGTIKDLCMHITVYSPAARVREEIDSSTADREREIYREEIKNKPADIQDKILEGKMNRFFAEKVLVEQVWVKDDKLTVAKAVAGDLGDGAGVTAFVRFGVGN